jgi:GTP cyclohydrolase I
MNTNLIAFLMEVTEEIQTEMTEQVTKFIKNFDEVSTMLTRIITAEELCVYYRARQPDLKNTVTQIGISELPTHFRNRITGKMGIPK